MIFPAGYRTRSVLADCAIGVVIALVSIPISMGYALVAGLPVVYGLYGSLLPIAVFALVTSSPRFVFGVDAAPAVLVGGMLSSLGIAFESAEAVQLVPCITLCVTFWLLLFFCIKADRILTFVSQPVMGGFISGIGITIILIQLPKLFGGTAGSGELFSLVMHILREAYRAFHAPSFALGVGTVALILLSRALLPKLPVQPLLMFAGAAATWLLHLEKLGIQTLPAVPRGLSPITLPQLSLIFAHYKALFFPSASIALVILSETLLATTNVALKHDETINTRREVLAYALGNLASAFTGSCPINGSVSRTGIANQYGVKSQIMSLSAAATMLLILLFGTAFIRYLPVPVLTGIVIAALIGTLEFSLARRLRAVDKTEYAIFFAAFFSVLLFGTIYGVAVGVLLSACMFIIRQSKPATDFLGIMPGLKGYYSLTRRDTAARAIQGAVIYRFSGPLFYANIQQFCADVTAAAFAGDAGGARVRAVVADASGITSIDATACARLVQLREKLRARGVRFYLAGHVSAVNDQLRSFGAESFIYDKVVRPRISLALSDAGFRFPYETEAHDASTDAFYSEQLAEFDWAFGSSSERLKEQLAHEAALLVLQTGTFDAEKIRELALRIAKGWWNDADEDDFLDLLEMQILTLQDQGLKRGIESGISLRHALLEERLLEHNDALMKKIVQRRAERSARLKEKHPAAYEQLELLHERYFTEIAMEQPELARRLATLISASEAGSKTE